MPSEGQGPKGDGLLGHACTVLQSELISMSFGGGQGDIGLTPVRPTVLDLPGRAKPTNQYEQARVGGRSVFQANA
jgi:hypothetical protein